MEAHETRPTVLIVDDAPENLQMLGQALAADYEVTMATSGRDALQMAGSDTPPDLILLDVIMPEMDGYEVCQALKSSEKTRDIPVIFITVRNEEHDETKGLELGAIDYITKPFSLPIVRARVRNHLELKRNRDLALSAIKAKSDFLASMSHEIRTPLNAILGNTELLLDTELNSEQRERIHVLEVAGDSLMALLNDLLDLSKIEAGMFDLEESDFELRKLLARTLSLVELEAQEKGLELHCDVASEVPERLRGDRNRLQQIIINLVTNAIKFTDEGSIEVRADVENEGAEEVTVRFTVTDTGIGIAPEDRERIFNRFAQADGPITRSQGGTGLGLSISRQLAEAMGGRLWVESDPGKGSRFHASVRFGLAREEDGAPVIDAQVSLVRPEIAGASILLAEDNVFNQGIATVMLKNLGFKVHIASNGAEAVRAVEKQPFDLILMDVQMPVMDGLEATRIIRERERRLSLDPIAIMGHSAYSSGEHRQRCLECGMDSYISKPLMREALIGALHECLGDRCTPPSPPPKPK